MPFDTELEDILFTIRMALMSCRTSPKRERNAHTRRFQAEAIVERLEHAGYRIVKTNDQCWRKAGQASCCGHGMHEKAVRETG
jgi:hypothetical protein